MFSRFAGSLNTVLLQNACPNSVLVVNLLSCFARKTGACSKQNPFKVVSSISFYPHLGSIQTSTSKVWSKVELPSLMQRNAHDHPMSIVQMYEGLSYTTVAQDHE